MLTKEFRIKQKLFEMRYMQSIKCLKLKGNEFHSKVEDAAIHNVDNVHAAQEAVKRYDAHIHRKILFEKYIHNLN
ncbi:Protein Gp66 [Listeria monocytogenes N53-1]|nr:Protein Gp66 [Listeria monocytogenes N53-1]